MPLKEKFSSSVYSRLSFLNIFHFFASMSHQMNPDLTRPYVFVIHCHVSNDKKKWIKKTLKVASKELHEVHTEQKQSKKKKKRIPSFFFSVHQKSSKIFPNTVWSNERALFRAWYIIKLNISELQLQTRLKKIINCLSE